VPSSSQGPSDYLDTRKCAPAEAGAHKDAVMEGVTGGEFVMTFRVYTLCRITTCNFRKKQSEGQRIVLSRSVCNVDVFVTGCHSAPWSVHSNRVLCRRSPCHIMATK
jgi:hypothetical protein